MKGVLSAARALLSHVSPTWLRHSARVGAARGPGVAQQGPGLGRAPEGSLRTLALLQPHSTASVNPSSRRSLPASPPPQALTTKGDLGVCPVHCRVAGTAGEPLSLALSTAPFTPDGTATGPVAHGQTESVLVAAASRPLGPAEVAAAVGALGDTPFRLTDGDAADSDGGSSMTRVRARTSSSSADPFVNHPHSALPCVVGHVGPGPGALRARQGNQGSAPHRRHLLAGAAASARPRRRPAQRRRAPRPACRGQTHRCDRPARCHCDGCENHGHRGRARGRRGARCARWRCRFGIGAAVVASLPHPGAGGVFGLSLSPLSLASLSLPLTGPLPHPGVFQVAAACAVPWLGEVVLDFLEVGDSRPLSLSSLPPSPLSLASLSYPRWSSWR